MYNAPTFSNYMSNGRAYTYGCWTKFTWFYSLYSRHSTSAAEIHSHKTHSTIKLCFYLYYFSIKFYIVQFNKLVVCIILNIVLHSSTLYIFNNSFQYDEIQRNYTKVRKQFQACKIFTAPIILVDWRHPLAGCSCKSIHKKKSIIVLQLIKHNLNILLLLTDELIYWNL